MVASFMSLSIIGGAVLQWPIGYLTYRLDRGNVISVISLIAALLAVPMLLGDGEKPVFSLIGGFIYGGFAFALYPLAVARMIDRLAPSEVFSGNGTLLLVYGIGAVISPMLVGSVMNHAGAVALPGLYILIELLLALMGGCWRNERRQMSATRRRLFRWCERHRLRSVFWKPIVATKKPLKV